MKMSVFAQFVRAACAGFCPVGAPPQRPEASSPPGAHNGYKKAHDECWPEILERQRARGVGMVIYRWGDRLPLSRSLSLGDSR